MIDRQQGIIAAAQVSSEAAAKARGTGRGRQLLWCRVEATRLEFSQQVRQLGECRGHLRTARPAKAGGAGTTGASESSL